jgi:hypothetical protein
MPPTHVFRLPFETRAARVARAAHLVAFTSLAFAAGCRSDDGQLIVPAEDPGPAATIDGAPTSLTGAFVPIYRPVSEAAYERRQEALTTTGAAPAGTDGIAEDFYLAISKKELGQRWFLSAYLSQVTPQGVQSGAARSLGTRVVSFKVQNGKLFVFDVVDDKTWSDNFRPDVVVEAYPIVNAYGPFERLVGASDYVLFDPAAGLNRFRLQQDSGVSVDVDLTFAQRFRKIPDGVTFDQVFSGTPNAFAQIPGTTQIVAPPRVTGTLSLGLRRYREGADYVPTAMPAKEFYFRGPAKLVPNEGKTSFVAAKWGLKPGSKPIVWKIAGTAAKLAEDPRFADIDFVGAAKAGIESWNEAFGFPAVEARLADPGESFGDDDVNYFIFDTSRSYTGAFANMRFNPNTGELRGASVYFPIGLLAATGELPPPSAVGNAGGLEAGAEPDAPASVTPPARWSWGIASEESLCDRPLPTVDEILAADVAGAPELPRKEKIERFLANIAAHEVGHTFGLRHNFKGSLKPPSSSVMEYIYIPDSIAIGPHVGSYDIAAIKYLYGLSPDLPTEPFCNDGDADTVDPDCRRFDFGANPLVDFFIPTFRDALALFFDGSKNSYVSPSALAPHIRLAKTGAARAQAYEGVFGPLRAPTPPAVDPTPLSFAARVNFATRAALRQLFIAPQPGQAVPAGQPAPAAPPPAEPVLTAAVADLRAFVVDGSGLRNGATRRLAVDVLKRLQSPGAYLALSDAREIVAAQLATLAGAAAVDTKDLLARIDRTLGAYFD